MPHIESIASQFVFDAIEAQYVDLTFTYVPSFYVIPARENWKSTVSEEQASDEEILRFAEKSKSLDFLNDKEEDDYSLDDGEPI